MLFKTFSLTAPQYSNSLYRLETILSVEHLRLPPYDTRLGPPSESGQVTALTYSVDPSLGTQQPKTLQHGCASA
jgi:hypothetical protein